MSQINVVGQFFYRKHKDHTKGGHPSCGPAFKPLERVPIRNYSKFFDEYVTFMTAYKESDDVASMANEYTAMMMQYLETMTALQEIDEDSLSDEEALYYAEVMLRINQKLLEVA